MSTALPLGHYKPMQMTWLPMNNHSTNPMPTKTHYSTTGTWHTNADDLTTLSVLIRLPMWHHLTVDPIPLENQSGTTWTVLIRQWIVVDCIILAQRHSITLDPPPLCAKVCQKLWVSPGLGGLGLLLPWSLTNSVLWPHSLVICSPELSTPQPFVHLPLECQLDAT